MLKTPGTTPIVACSDPSAAHLYYPDSLYLDTCSQTKRMDALLSSSPRAKRGWYDDTWRAHSHWHDGQNHLVRFCLLVHHFCWSQGNEKDETSIHSTFRSYLPMAHTQRVAPVPSSTTWIENVLVSKFNFVMTFSCQCYMALSVENGEDAWDVRRTQWTHACFSSETLVL